MYFTVAELLLFLTMQILIKMLLLVWTSVTVHLMIPFIVYTLKIMRIRLTLFCFKPWRIGLQVFFTTPCLLLVVLRFVKSIVFDIPGSMCSACYSWVSSLPAVLALRDFKVHIDATYSGNEASNVKTTVNN